jgi:lipopolysaccharide/colanic/teichoic acid biosynthesis glycosyltransferase
MIRFFDIFFSGMGLFLLSPLIIILIVLGYLDTGSPIFKQDRVGINLKPFKLLKFRSMNLNSDSIATHLSNPCNVTIYGKFLRNSKLDEIPQLMNVLKGDMSLVGPRPNLFNQEELIVERKIRGIYDAKPGITGLAQINNIDMSNPVLLSETDAKMLEEFNLIQYFKFIFLTFLGNGFGDRLK